MSEWISVMDRLPLEINYSRSYEQIAVLATDGARVIMCNFDAGHGCGKPWIAWNTFNDLSEDSITHWMPLPEPPK